MKQAFGASEESVGQARRYVSGMVSDLPAELQDSVSLMVSELATNALLHASGGFDVAVDRSDTVMTVSVTDQGGGLPAVQSPSATEPHGRGLRIVESLSDEWGITSTPAIGKTVWFRMSLIGAPIGRPDLAAVATGDEHGNEPANDDSSHPTSQSTGPGADRVDRPKARVDRSRPRKASHSPIVRSRAPIPGKCRWELRPTGWAGRLGVGSGDDADGAITAASGLTR